MNNLIMDVALKSGQKVAASITAKVVTSVSSALTARTITRSMESKCEPLTNFTDEEEREKEAQKRIIRDSAITGIITATGGIIFKVIDKAIDESDIIL